MGLLSLGTPLSWKETKPLADHVREHGITQFLHTWARWKDVKEGKGFLWGDEVRGSGLFRLFFSWNRKGGRSSS